MSPQIVIAAALVAAGAAGGWFVKTAIVNTEKLAQIEADKFARKAQERRESETDQKQVKLRRAAEDAAAGARTELERLRQSIASRPQGSCEPARAARAEELLGECAGRYQEVARDAQRYADQLRGWQELIAEDQ